jgi:uncharacterized membrane protein (DUF373 family)
MASFPRAMNIFFRSVRMLSADNTAYTKSIAALRDVRRRWAMMTLYERFEQLVALALSLIIAVLIVIALIQLYEHVLPLVLGGGLDPLNHQVFQTIFGSIFTVLIAMEFKHSIVKAAVRRDGIIQVRTVLLIGLLAMSRKFVILDASETPAATIVALAAVTLVLGAVYWLLKDQGRSV